MNGQTTSMLMQDKIALRAYEIWKKAGRPEGKDLEHWQQAERALSAKQCSLVSQPLIAAAANCAKNRGSGARIAIGV